MKRFSGSGLGSGRFIAIVMLLIVTVAGTGCFDIFAAKEFFLPTPDDTVEYQSIEKYSLDYPYNSPLISLQPALYEDYNTQADINIIDGTRWLVIDIELEMLRGDQILELLPPALREIIEELGQGLGYTNITETIKSLERHVWIMLSKPDGYLWQEFRYNSTAGELIRIPTPEVGSWTLKIESRGFGTDLYHDQLNIVVNADEPKPKD